MKPYVIDFAPGLHGHFLEYVINRYIFAVDAQVKSIFQSSGACHSINTDPVYQAHKLIDRGHYSAFGYDYPISAKKIVFIKHDSELDFVLLTNIYYRCHPDSITVEDFNVDEIKQLHQSMMFSGTDSDLKNNWYNKLMEHHFDHADQQPSTHLPVFRFRYQSFFRLYDFLLELKAVADFLEHTFRFDHSLVPLWQDFIARNQGLSLWQTSNELFGSVVSNNDVDIPNDWKLHAHLNYQISRVFQLYDHPRLFGQEPYPVTTKQVHDIIVDHVNGFDQRW